MKTFLFISLCFAASGVVRAVEFQKPPVMSVSGSAEVKVAPDEIVASFGVESRNSSLGAAKASNDQAVANALAFLRQEGIADKDVKTDHISIDPTYDARGSSSSPQSFVVRKSIQVKIADVAKFEQILAGLIENGITNVHGVDYRTTKLRQYRDEARALAIRAAREKAQDLAKALGVRLGRVYSVDAQDGGGAWMHGSGWGRPWGYGAAMQNAVQQVGGESVGSETLSVGQISVSAAVSVCFLIDS